MALDKLLLAVVAACTSGATMTARAQGTPSPAPPATTSPATRDPAFRGTLSSAPAMTGAWLMVPSSTVLQFAYARGGKGPSPTDSYGAYLTTGSDGGVLFDMGVLAGHINRPPAGADFGLGAHLGLGYGVTAWQLNLMDEPRLGIAVGLHAQLNAAYFGIGPAFDFKGRTATTGGGLAGVAIEVASVRALWEVEIHVQATVDLLSPRYDLTVISDGLTEAKRSGLGTRIGLHLQANQGEANPTPLVVSVFSEKGGSAAVGAATLGLAIGLAY